MSASRTLSGKSAEPTVRLPADAAVLPPAPVEVVLDDFLLELHAAMLVVTASAAATPIANLLLIDFSLSGCPGRIRRDVRARAVPAAGSCRYGVGHVWAVATSVRSVTVTSYVGWVRNCPDTPGETTRRCRPISDNSAVTASSATISAAPSMAG